VTKTITITLTLAEAKALSQAVGNSLYSPEDAMDILGDKRSVDAAYRASEKIDAAIQTARSKVRK
jgi:hypothetical protein